MALILLYHRITRVDSDPWELCVDPATFTEHLKVLQRHYAPRRLAQITDLNSSENARAVAITFDDGTIDNLHEAKPLLEAYEVPATFFVTTDGMDVDREFWWDELDYLLLSPGILPKVVALEIDKEHFVWNLGNDSVYTDFQRQAVTDWRAWLPCPTLRHTLYYELWKRLFIATPSVRDHVLSQIRALIPSSSLARNSHRTLKPSEIAELARGELLEVGSHTMTHSRLSGLEHSDQVAEVTQSKRYLEQFTGHPVTSFSYPFGKIGDYTAASIEVVRSAGYQRACSNSPDVVSPSTAPFELPRFHVPNWTGEEFLYQLEAWTSHMKG